MIALGLGGLEDFVFRYKWIPAATMFLTFYSVADGMERVFWIEDELRFDERKLPAIFSAITVEQYADVGLVVEELVFVYVLSLVLEKSCKGCSQQ